MSITIINRNNIPNAQNHPQEIEIANDSCEIEVRIAEGVEL